MASAPIDHSRLEQIASNACESVVGASTAYEADKVSQQNSEIINAILKDLLDASPSSQQYKYIVNSTIVQHAAPNHSENAAALKIGDAGRRGLHSGCGAYWDSERDGTWTWQFDGLKEGKSGSLREFDVIVNIIWVAV